MRYLVLFGTCLSALAQLTPEQRVQDFQAVSNNLVRYYAPTNWKMIALGHDPLNVSPWLDRVRRVQSDLEYYDLVIEYITSLQDGHTTYSLPSTFSANLGIRVDLYDGRLLVDQINRARYPLVNLPFDVGDELVSLDGVPTSRIIDDLMCYVSSGNPRARRRLAADYVTSRPQSIMPRSVELPDQAEAVFRKPDGTEVRFTLTWLKSGMPFRAGVPVPAARASELPEDDDTWATRLPVRAEADPVRVAARNRPFEQDPEGVLGWGSRTPYYGLPEGWTQRRGGGSDHFFSGIYTSNGVRLGLIRIPSFSPANTIGAIREFESEITYFRANTDGLIVDVTRNPGGSVCFVNDLAMRLMPGGGTGIQWQLKPNQYWLTWLDSVVRSVPPNAPGWVLENYRFNLQTVRNAGQVAGAMPGIVPTVGSCLDPFPVSFDGRLSPARDVAGQVVGYDKPIIILADEFSASGADMFPAMLQDNRRGPIVGMRTAGAGGSVVAWDAGALGEGFMRITMSLLYRQRVASRPGLPPAPLIENLGVEPDIVLDFMTRDNLIHRGRPFVDAFTRIAVENIRNGGN